MGVKFPRAPVPTCLSAPVLQCIPLSSLAFNKYAHRMMYPLKVFVPSSLDLLGNCRYVFHLPSRRHPQQAADVECWAEVQVSGDAPDVCPVSLRRLMLLPTRFGNGAVIFTPFEHLLHASEPQKDQSQDAESADDDGQEYEYQPEGYLQKHAYH